MYNVLGMLNQDSTAREFREEDIQEMLLLAARLRESHGGELDDNAIQAVSEATGAPAEYVRIALHSVEAKSKIKPVSKWRSFYLSFDPDVRRYVVGGWLGCMAGFFGALGATFGDRSSFMGVLMILTLCAAVWNSAQARDTKIGATAGAAYAGLYFISRAAFLFILSLIPTLEVGNGPPAMVLLPIVALGALGGGAAKRLLNRNLTKLGLKDAADERQELLRQLVELQDKLRTGEQSVTFLSIDVVGSTRMKEGAEPLAIEYTFSEYHRYVETIVKRYAGRVHSTAGDGVTCAFEDADKAFRAARNIQSGLIELNTHRNKIGTPIKLRIGMHAGTVIAPTQDIQSLNFAHVIDIAAHLQKVCPIGGVAVSEAALTGVPGGKQTVGEEIVSAQDVNARVWMPRVAIPAVASGSSTA